MVTFKACPRCHGDIETTWDMYGNYKQCLQCGYVIYLESGRKSFPMGEKPKVGRPRKVQVQEPVEAVA